MDHYHKHLLHHYHYRTNNSNLKSITDLPFSNQISTLSTNTSIYQPPTCSSTPSSSLPPLLWLSPSERTAPTSLATTFPLEHRGRTSSAPAAQPESATGTPTRPRSRASTRKLPVDREERSGLCRLVGWRQLRPDCPVLPCLKVF